jgi:chitodextrinase/murein DD-endopeptidase MepM/ murein hydrolase activator NlpD
VDLTVGKKRKASADKTPPSTPSHLHLTAHSRTSVTVAWTASTDNVAVAGYSIYRDGTHVANLTGTSASLSSLACGRTYRIGIGAYDAASNHSAITSIVPSTASCPDTTAPSAPTNVHLTARTTTSVTVAWTASTDNVGVAGYSLSINGNHVKNVTGTSSTLVGLSCSGSYTVGVEAYDAVSNHSATTTASVSTSPCPSVLSSGETLQPNQELISPNGTYRLVMQYDGNLVEYQGSTPLWASNTAGDNGATVTMQGDGNLVIYLNGVPKWASNTAGFPGDSLALQDDSNLVIYQGSHALWDRHSGYIGDHLYAGITLQPGQELISQNGTYRLVMQYDGNLVEYKGSTALWASNTAGDNGATVTMQGDGNLVIYLSGVPKWASNTAGHSGAFLVLQNDANAVIYANGSALWANNAGQGGSGSVKTEVDYWLAHVTQYWNPPVEDGTDFSMPLDTAVFAVQGGTVLGAGYYAGGGVVSVNAGSNQAEYYQHLDCIYVGVGQAVSAGQEIGTSGGSLTSQSPAPKCGHYSTSQYSSGPHIEFGINAPYGGMWNPNHWTPNVNPLPLLQTLG